MNKKSNKDFTYSINPANNKFKKQYLRYTKLCIMCRGRDWLRPVPISTLLQTGTDYVYLLWHDYFVMTSFLLQHRTPTVSTLLFLLNILWLCKVGNREQGWGSVLTGPKPTLLQTDTDNAQAERLYCLTIHFDPIILITLRNTFRLSLLFSEIWHHL